MIFLFPFGGICDRSLEITVFHFLYLKRLDLFQTCGFVWYWSALIGRKGWCWKEWRIYGTMWFFRHTKFNGKSPPFSGKVAALGDEVWDIYVASIRVMALVRSFWGLIMDWFNVTFSKFKNLDILCSGKARHPSNIAGWIPLSIATLLRLGRSWRKCHWAPAAQNSGTLESSGFRVGRRSIKNTTSQIMTEMHQVGLNLIPPKFTWRKWKCFMCFFGKEPCCTNFGVPFPAKKTTQKHVVFPYS